MKCILHRDWSLRSGFFYSFNLCYKFTWEDELHGYKLAICNQSALYQPNKVQALWHFFWKYRALNILSNELCALHMQVTDTLFHLQSVTLVKGDSKSFFKCFSQRRCINCWEVTLYARRLKIRTTHLLLFDIEKKRYNLNFRISWKWLWFVHGLKWILHAKYYELRNVHIPNSCNLSELHFHRIIPDFKIWSRNCIRSVFVYKELSFRKKKDSWWYHWNLIAESRDKFLVESFLLEKHPIQINFQFRFQRISIRCLICYS